MTDQQAIEQLASWLNHSSFTVVLSGAGMSTESGIPDFRSHNGLWKNFDPAYVSSVEALDNHYDLFNEFYSLRLQDVETCNPHEGYEALARLQQNGLIHAIATQNVDGFHRRAGGKNIYELHGSLHNIYCHTCNKVHSAEDFKKGSTCSCGGKLRPSIVLFGELLPEEVWHQAMSAIRQADLVLIIGTSLQVYPVNQLPSMAKGKTVLINREPTSMDYLFDLSIYSSAKDTLLEVEQLCLKR
ncbi:SIR2 family NAD-dependent protein deacylase [Fictibacillus sp. S7]|uniref:SIR2 family NAD-dependent protein deacylase n=1 Tax=Fictibacillus sp. S7 TaxID=2212476 RepID=UPI0010128AD8|nr:NAD-dependent deacylase [Fictibacillus sp. S7]RXZ00434.1 NAD-dependent protein deacylase [Fictibacillus sp. S7]